MLHPRLATVAGVLLCNEYVTRGTPTAPDDVLVEIVDEVYLRLDGRRSLIVWMLAHASDEGTVHLEGPVIATVVERTDRFDLVSLQHSANERDDLRLVRHPGRSRLG
jgi:hypothetical protein